MSKTKPTYLSINPRLEQLETLGRIAVYRVDGEQIRAHLDKDFTNFGQHYRFLFIPVFEFWIDREASHDEVSFFVNHLETEWKLMRKGMGYDQALKIADRKEQSMRKMVDGIIPGKKGDPNRARLVPIEQGAEYTIWLVDGEYVRDAFFNDFTEGGHGYVYNFIPKNEIWIDDDVEEEERPFIMMHESHERALMMEGMSYSEAHKRANVVEYHARQLVQESGMEFSSDTLESLFQTQFNRERQNHAAYEALAATLENDAWDGFAKWMHKSAMEEHEHAKKFAEFLIDRNIVPQFLALDAAGGVPYTPLIAFISAQTLEKENTASINDLYAACVNAEDYDACLWLKWALEEQRKSERELKDIIAQLQRAGDNNAALLILDKELGGV